MVLAAIFLLCLAACQQKEPKMKDGKILLTVCMESSVGLPNAEKGTTMENSIQSCPLPAKIDRKKVKKTE